MLCAMDDSGVYGSLSSLQTLKLRGKKVTPRSLSRARVRALIYISDTYAYRLGGKEVKPRQHFTFYCLPPLCWR